MSITYDLDAEQELANTYLRRWQDILHLGDWWVTCFVQSREHFTGKEEDAFVLMNEMSRVARIFVLSGSDRISVDVHSRWENNLELTVLHELCHILLFDLSPGTFKDEGAKEREEKVVNKLSMLFYGLYHQTDPTQEEANGRRSCTKEEERAATQKPGSGDIF